MGRATTRAAGALATSVLLLAGPMAPEAMAAETHTVQDERGDAALRTEPQWEYRGPAFTPRIDPQALDIKRVDVVNAETMSYVRIQFRNFYGSVLVSDRQQGKQDITVELWDDRGSNTVGADIFHRTYGERTPPAVSRNGQFTEMRCATQPPSTVSTTGDWVLLRIPHECGPDDAHPIAEVTVAARNTVERRNAGGVVTSHRAWEDHAVVETPAPPAG